MSTPVHTFHVVLKSGQTEVIKANGVGYDDLGNLAFLEAKPGIVTAQNPNGEAYSRAVKTINRDAWETFSIEYGAEAEKPKLEV